MTAASLPPDADDALGAPLPDWRPPPWPHHAPLEGRWARLEPLEADAHAADLHAANRASADNAIWRYLPYGPFGDLGAYGAWVGWATSAPDPMFFAIRPITDGVAGPAAGVASWLRITPAAGSIEVGHICFAPMLQRSPAATEAMFLMMRRAFELGYRRYEWKCNALNQGSRRAAMRLGLSYEGVFRQATVSKGRNRDTAWYAAIDTEWPALETAFAQWLSLENFDDGGRQRSSLSSLTAPILTARG